MVKHNRAGFTLIELMIVVAIIAIIAAIAIPNLIRSRMLANESGAVGDLRAILTAQTAFQASNYRYTVNFAELTGATPPFLDGDWGAARHGYLYTLGGNDDFFTCVAYPTNFGVSGSRDFFVDISGVIRYDMGGDATAASTPLGE